MKRWHVFERSAEGNALFFVRLSREEYGTICRFLSQQNNGPDEGNSGCIEIFTHENFKTRKEAEDFAKIFWLSYRYM